MDDFQKEVEFSLHEIKKNLNKIDSIEVNFFTLKYLYGNDFEESDYETKMNHKKYGTLFDKIHVYGNGSLSHGEVKINYKV